VFACRAWSEILDIALMKAVVDVTKNAALCKAASNGKTMRIKETGGPKFPDLTDFGHLLLFALSLIGLCLAAEAITAASAAIAGCIRRD
jgi:hypothetical protein